MPRLEAGVTDSAVSGGAHHGAEEWAMVIEERARIVDPLNGFNGIPELRTPERSELISIVREDPSVGYYWW